MRQLIFPIGGRKTTIELPDYLIFRTLSELKHLSVRIFCERYFAILEYFMLTKDELLTQKEKPNIRDISLRLYKEFSEEVLLKQKFIYYFTDGTNIQIEFREWGIYHMLSIQHINGRIDRNKFFQAIDEGLELSSFQENKAINNRFRNQKERITIFSCVYSALKEANAFYIPSGKVKNTKSVKSDYIIF